MSTALAEKAPETAPAVTLDEQILALKPTIIPAFFRKMYGWGRINEHCFHIEYKLEGNSFADPKLKLKDQPAVLSLLDLLAQTLGGEVEWDNYFAFGYVIAVEVRKKGVPFPQTNPSWKVVFYSSSRDEPFRMNISYWFGRH